MSMKVNNTLEWMPEDLIDAKSALVHVMAGCLLQPTDITWNNVDQDVWHNMTSLVHEFNISCFTLQGSKFHSSDRLRRVKMTVGQVEYLQDLSNGRLRISDFHISCIGFMYFRQVNGTFGQVKFTIHLPDGQMHSILNFEACSKHTQCCKHRLCNRVEPYWTIIFLKNSLKT